MIESFTIKIIDVIVKGQNCRLLHQKKKVEKIRIYHLYGSRK